MPVLNTTGIVDDAWVLVADSDPIPANTAALVSWDRVTADNGQALEGRDPRGIVVSSDIEAAKLLPFMSRLGVIVVRPANFKDGRIFSVGRLLRQRYGFNGDLRVLGDIIPDQVPFLVRCGFTSFDVAENFDTAAALRLLKVFPFNYQTGILDRNINALRHGKPEHVAGRAS